MAKFKVGDRVRVYGPTFQYYGEVGTIVGMFELVFTVKIDSDNRNYNFHPKQLRRLKPRKKRLEMWINFYGADSWSSFQLKEEAIADSSRLNNCDLVNTVHMREVRTK